MHHRSAISPAALGNRLVVIDALRTPFSSMGGINDHRKRRAHGHDGRQLKLEALAVLQILDCARQSIRTRWNDDYCLELLGRCAAKIREIFHLSVSKTPAIDPGEPVPDLASVLCLLSYLHSEIGERLNEAYGASLIELCSLHLIETFVEPEARASAKRRDH